MVTRNSTSDLDYMRDPRDLLLTDEAKVNDFNSIWTGLLPFYGMLRESSDEIHVDEHAMGFCGLVDGGWGLDPLPIYLLFWIFTLLGIVSRSLDFPHPVPTTAPGHHALR
ncbi:hypothetical protein GJ744_011519 [Endocarpon pusillum]|uniref:Uncharacterized protein n=1 Tax=Endocarpon pusillum TaxID=364733 RepID=A0A8H7AKC3_9EURO|nr:hypothetical protein GJ744_011519 [Endocarpon pusillum]